MKLIIKSLFILVIFTFISCNQTNDTDNIPFQCPMDCEVGKTYTEPGSCPVCNMDLRQKETKILSSEGDEISETSIFNLTSEWKTQNDETINLKDLKGQTLVAVMIYTTCQAACPRLVADMRNIEKAVPVEYLEDVKYVFISIDPETDTPEKLKIFAKENIMDDEHHVFLQGTIDDVREFANVLAVKYKEISPIDFSHSNIISVFNPKGELEFQQEGLNIDNKNTIKAIIDASNTK